MKPFYDRYRLLKQLLFASAAATVITTIVSKHLKLSTDFLFVERGEVSGTTQTYCISIMWLQLTMAPEANTEECLSTAL